MTGALQPLVLGFGRDQLIANAGIIGGAVFGLTVLLLILVAILPAYSDRWAERLGTSETTPAGPDPTETIPGRDEPIPASQTGQADDAAAPEPEVAGEADGEAVDDAGSESVTPEPEVAGESEH